jgi:hypothetical protein
MVMVLVGGFVLAIKSSPRDSFSGRRRLCAFYCVMARYRIAALASEAVAAFDKVPAESAAV